MSSISPTLEGFRVVFRRPSLALAEITWRWTFGAAASALFLFALFQYLGTLPVTKGDLLFLRTGQPILIGQALSHILRGSLGRVLMALVLGALSMICFWICAASMGRLTTVRALLDYFRQRFAPGGSTDALPSDSSSLRALLGLNFLRAALALATIFGIAGASTLAGFVSPDSHPRPALAFILFLPLAGLIAFASWGLNWILSLGGIFAVRDGDGTLDALSAAVAFSRERSGPVAAVSTWIGLAHLAVFIVATTVVPVPLGLARIIPGRVVMLLILLLTLAYFAVADWLYVARMAGYVCILDMPAVSVAPLPPVAVPPAGPAISATIDRDEPILSDVPNLAVEM